MISAALAVLYGSNSTATRTWDDQHSEEGEEMSVREVKGPTPMPVLKLNFHDPSASQFVASHASHSSHRSHSSHYSHRSGAVS